MRYTDQHHHRMADGMTEGPREYSLVETFEEDGHWKALPPGLPSLLVDALHWLAEHPVRDADGWGMCVGGWPVGEEWGAGAEDFGSEMVVFLMKGEGSSLALWRRGNQPIVLIGSEGEAEVFGSSVIHFLARAAFDDELAADYNGLCWSDSPVVTARRREFGAWLAHRSSTSTRALRTLAKQPAIPSSAEFESLVVGHVRAVEDADEHGKAHPPFDPAAMFGDLA